MNTTASHNALARLEELRALNVISDREYAMRRAEILDRGSRLGSYKGGKGKGHPGKGYPERADFWDPGWASPPGFRPPAWHGGGGKGKPAPPSEADPQSRVLLVTFKDSAFPGHDAVAAHFSGVATVEKITHITKPDREQALIQVATVDEAFNCLRTLSHSSAEWCHDIDVQRARVPELTFRVNDQKNKSYIPLQPGRVLLLTLEGLRGPFPGLDAIHDMFKIYGAVERISHIPKPDREQCMVQFADPAAAAAALAGLQGWNMGFCVFSLQIARTDALTFKQSDERNKDYTEPV